LAVNGIGSATAPFREVEVEVGDFEIFGAIKDLPKVFFCEESVAAKAWRV
jgi:hypothetical protein